ncbi:thiopeptide-type bacteriocin biosynthesis protein [Amycolatopsis thermoflava]|uniref:thiopeptide-type bacteriocin biosynthesis protein n=1 Tax=Amycolatopsis thermoflava TaxID=84480 RepID=UPI001E62CFD5|nr:thiopeptide-type bacteriocin biosynthesis protein [Amycolatopsis thermoflava]
MTTRPPAPDPLDGALPAVTNTLGQLPGAPGSRWISAKLFTHPERIDELITDELPDLLSTLDAPLCWWLRYRSLQETDHLRLRLEATPGHYSQYTQVIGEWTQRMRQAGLVERLVIDTYYPEVGRYGAGEALDAAENVFAADSATAAALLRYLPTATPKLALVPVNMAGILTGFFGDTGAAMEWLATRPAPAAPALDRAVSEHAIRLATDPSALRKLLGWHTDIERAWDNRTAALTDYRKALPPETNTDVVLESLLHMHHNRLIGIDRDSERSCRRLTRHAALTWQHRGGAG